MKAQTTIVTEYIKWESIKQLAGYSVSALFGIIAGLILAFAPPANHVAAEIIAISFGIVAAGVSGYTFVRAKTHHVEIAAGQSPSEKPEPIGKRRS